MDLLKFYKVVKSVERGHSTLYLGQIAENGGYQVAWLQNDPKTVQFTVSPVYIHFEHASTLFDNILEKLKSTNVIPIR